jgi:hypothetical protein
MRLEELRKALTDPVMVVGTPAEVRTEYKLTVSPLNLFAR